MFIFLTNHRRGEIMDKVRQFLLSEIESVLNRRGLEYFIGGSVRFNFADPSSDIDIFVLIEDKYFIEELIDKLSGICSDIKETFNSNYEEISRQQFTIHNMIHINCIRSLQDFNGLRSEHDKIESLIQKDHSLVISTLAKELKKQGVKVYPILKKLLK